MGLRSRLEIEYKGIFFFMLFYLITGIMNFIILGLHGLGLFHVALVAVISLIAAFGLYRLQSWSLWFVVALFFIATTYDVFMLNASWEGYAANPDLSGLFTILVWVVYLMLTWIATIYVAAKRKNLR